MQHEARLLPAGFRATMSARRLAARKTAMCEKALPDRVWCGLDETRGHPVYVKTRAAEVAGNRWKKRFGIHRALPLAYPKKSALACGKIFVTFQITG